MPVRPEIQALPLYRPGLELASARPPLMYNNSCDNLHSMTAEVFRQARLAKGWNQTETARRLGVSQPYVAMLEAGARHVSPRLASRAVGVFGLPPSALPTPAEPTVRVVDSASLAKDLAVLGYPGFRYLHSPHARPKNPAEVLLTALAQHDLEARVVEGLPWVLLKYPSLDRPWLVQQAKLCDLQNRLGFVAALARRFADERASANEGTLMALRRLETDLEPSRLAREDTLCKRLSESERAWVMAKRTEDAKHWNMVSDLRSEFLRFAA